MKRKLLATIFVSLLLAGCTNSVSKSTNATETLDDHIGFIESIRETETEVWLGSETVNIPNDMFTEIEADFGTLKEDDCITITFDSNGDAIDVNFVEDYSSFIQDGKEGK